MTLVFFSLVGFLAGSIPFGLLVVRLAGKGDVRSVGSGNIGATNAARAGGRWLGILTLALDVTKGFLPVYFYRCLGADGTALSLVALTAVMGHVFTPWLRFRGGKGVATALGTALAFSPWMILPPFGVFLATVALTRYVSLGSVLAALALPISLLARLSAGPSQEQVWTKPTLVFAAWLGIALVVIFKHSPNIRRLLKGTENRLWGGNTSVPEADQGSSGTTDV
jgi:glycerol-3-phosphate acyltransferase PlsY